jgi:glycosyltransferase involved in cell wall biosynthesis
LLLAAGEISTAWDAPCPTVRMAGLEDRRASPVALDDLEAAFRPDLVHVHAVVNPRALEWAARRNALVTVQDHRYFCPGQGKLTLGGGVCVERLSRESCAACFEDPAYFGDVYELTGRRLAALSGATVIVLSHYMKRELVAAGVDSDRVNVIPPFVHGLDRGAPPMGPACVAFVGRLAESKGPREALRAWRESGVDLPLAFAGSGPLRHELEAGGAEVLGWLSRPALSRLYRRARVIVMPSRWQEPFGIVGIEALAFGIPVAAWASGGIPEWHPGPGLVAWGDVSGLADALRSLAGSATTPDPRFDEASLMARLEATYAAARGFA